MTTAIISVETVLLLILLVLVAGLLRSHAEILRRLGTTAAEPAGAGAVPVTAPARAPGAPAAPLTGPTPAGDAISLDFTASGGEPTLLAFLTSGCGTCAGFWETLGETRLPPEVRTVVVTHGSERERPARLRSLAPEGVPVIMSSQAWQDYAVPGAPYFVLVDGAIRGEGAATSWTALGSLVSDAIEDQRESGGQARVNDVDRKLEAAGIGPDHASLHPAGGGPDQ
ncbi:MAG: TlpA family protein disulfide reductase [Solirubrobacteraceae bacterium]